MCYFVHETTYVAYLSFQQVTVMCFIDFASAFESVDRLPMADNGGGWNVPQTLEADQGVLLVDQGEG